MDGMDALAYCHIDPSHPESRQTGACFLFEDEEGFLC